MKYASMGSISQRTLRIEDLLKAFSSTLEDCVTRNLDLNVAEREILTKLILEAREVDPDSEGADFVMEDLGNALEGFAPPDCRFGSHEGDGADFGFWPNQDDI